MVGEMKRVALVLVALFVAGGLWAGQFVSRQGSPRSLVMGLDGYDAVNCYARLSESEGEELEQALQEGACHTNPRVRVQCARLMGQRQDVTMVRYLRPMLSDRDEGVRNQAARSLIPLLDDPELLELLQGAQLTSSAQVVMARAMLDGPEAVANTPLLDWCLDRAHTPEVRGGAYLALRDSSSCLVKDARKSVQVAQARILKQVKSDAFDAGCPLPARTGALQLYAALRGKEGLDEIQPLTRSQDPAVSEAAILAVSSTREDRAAEWVCAICKDPGRPLSTRALAVGLLRRFRWNRQALETARLTINEDEPSLRSQAARCLAVLGDKNAPEGSYYSLAVSRDLLQKALDREKNPEAQTALRNALCSLDARQPDPK